MRYELVDIYTSLNERFVEYQDYLGNKVVLNNVNEPIKEATEFLKTITKKPSALLMIGIGNGSIIQQFITENLHLNKKIIIIEPFEKLIIDKKLKKLLAKSQISFHYYKNLSSLQILSILENIIGLHIELVIHPNYDLTNVSYLREIIKTIKTSMEFYYRNRNTEKYFRKDWILEPLNNLKFTFGMTPINELEGKFKNDRAVLCASGPSLNENINTLKQLKENSYIFAAGSAVNGLIENDIMPDFVTSFDSSVRNYEAHFKNSDYNGTLIVGSIVNSKIVSSHKGEILLVLSGNDEVSPRYLENVEQFRPVPSVALFSLQILFYLGFKEILLVGQDLSLIGGKYYSKGVHEHVGMQNENAELYIEDNAGGKVGTTYSLYSFLETFEEMLELNDKINIYNLSLYGAKIKGAPYLSPENISLNQTRKSDNIFIKKNREYVEGYSKINDFICELNELFLCLTKLKSESQTSRNKSISKETVEKSLKMLIQVREFPIVEDVLIHQFNIEIQKINNITEYALKQGFDKEIAQLLIEQVDNIVCILYVFVKELINDERITSEMKKIGILDYKK